MVKTKKTIITTAVTENSGHTTPSKSGFFVHGGRKLAVIIAVLLLITGAVAYRIVYKTESVTVKPGSAQAKAYDLISHGTTAQQAGDLNAAIRDYRAADKVWPNQPIVQSNLADAYFSLKDKNNSVYYYQKAIQLVEHDSKSVYKNNISTWQAAIEQAKKSDFEFRDETLKQ